MISRNRARKHFSNEMSMLNIKRLACQCSSHCRCKLSSSSTWIILNNGSTVDRGSGRHHVRAPSSSSTTSSSSPLSSSLAFYFVLITLLFSYLSSGKFRFYFFFIFSSLCEHVSVCLCLCLCLCVCVCVFTIDECKRVPFHLTHPFGGWQ